MASRGPVERVLSSLEGGGDACAEMLIGMLEHAMGMLEELSVSSPLKARRSLRDVSDRVETVLESVDAEWCDGVSQCAHDELARLSGLVVSACGLSSSSVGSEASGVVSDVIDCLDRCVSVVVQSMGVLSGSDDGAGSGSDGVLIALESLRGMSEARLESVCADEAAAYEAVMSHVSGLESCVGAETVSGCMAMFTLGCRNGLALCGTVEVLEVACGLYCSWFESASGGSDDYAAGAASSAIYFLTTVECGPKTPSESRGPVDKAFGRTMKRIFGLISKAFTEERVQEVFNNSMKAGMLSREDISLACGWSGVVLFLGYPHPGALPAADEAGVFSAALALNSRVEPSPLPAEWWSSTYGVCDVTSARLGHVWLMFSHARRLPATQCTWWGELLARAIRNSKMNASAGLSGRDAMSFYNISNALMMVELAAQNASQHEMLVESGVMDALEYGILNDFRSVGNSIAAYASGAAVALVGRNEGGKVLGRGAVLAVLAKMHTYFQPESWAFDAPAKAVMANFNRVPIMAISDANKKHMLLFEPLIDVLLQCLIIDEDNNHRKGQDGADALQEASAGVLHDELSLFGPGTSALRSHPDAVSTLHKLCDVGTKVSKERGAAALFELEQDKRPTKTIADDDDGTGTGLSTRDEKTPPPHVMASYNWDHQEVIMRVVGSLQSRGYLVWVDLEQMKGSTVDTMSLAVEGSEVVLIGVSRAYKESSNCRMEAQYCMRCRRRSRLCH